VPLFPVVVAVVVGQIILVVVLVVVVLFQVEDVQLRYFHLIVVHAV